MRRLCTNRRFPLITRALEKATATPSSAQLPVRSIRHGNGTTTSFQSIFPSTPTKWRLFSMSREDPGEYDRQILNLLDQRHVDYIKLDRTFAKIYQEKTAWLQLETFFFLVKRLQKLKDPRALEALSTFILGWMINFHSDHRLDRLPKKELFGMALQCYAQSKRSTARGETIHPQAGAMAEQFLNKMEQLVHQKVLGIDIDATSYNTVMKIYAMRGNAEKVQAIFDRCMQNFKQGNASAKPDIISWSTLIEAYEKSGKPNAGKLALGILREAEKDLKDGPNTICYTSVIDALAKSYQPEKAHEILEEMNDSFLAGNTAAQPNIHSFNAILNAWAQLGTKEQSNEGVEGARRNEKILDRMDKLFEEGTLPLRPNTHSYSTVISAYGRQGLPRDAQRVMVRQYNDFLDGNLSAEPNEECFLGVIEGWSKSGEAIAGQHAELILDHMEKLHSQNTLKAKPDVFIYNAVMKAWGAVGEPKKAALVFHRMLDDFERGNRTAKPTALIYSTLMNAYATAKLSDAGELADDALNHMKEMKVEPNLPVYRAATQCWRCSKDRDPVAGRRWMELQDHIDKLEAIVYSWEA